MFLTPTQARRLLNDAVERRYAILAINADSPAAIYDCLEAARECDSPVIIEASLWQLKGHSFGVGDARLGLARYLTEIALLGAQERFQQVPIIFHTDHIKGPETFDLLAAAIVGVDGLRASTISLDSSAMSEDENLEMIGRLCRTAGERQCDLTLEVEAGLDTEVVPVEVCDRIVGIAERNHPGYLALWAPGVGTQHGLSEGGYPSFDAEAVRRHQERASELCQRPIGIALHGSSGLPAESLQEAVANGAVKINWSSESLLIRSSAAQSYYQEKAPELNKSHGSWKITAMDNGLQSYIAERYQPAVRSRITILGSAGQGARFLKALQS